MSAVALLLWTLALAQAPAGSADLADFDQPRTRVERVLDSAYDAMIDAGQFSCSSGNRHDHREVEALHVRYERVFAELERHLGRHPYQRILLADCLVRDRADYWQAVHRARSRLNQAERMLRRGETD